MKTFHFSISLLAFITLFGILMNTMQVFFLTIIRKDKQERNLSFHYNEFIFNQLMGQTPLVRTLNILILNRKQFNIFESF